jgi:hypothetical protein
MTYLGWDGSGHQFMTQISSLKQMLHAIFNEMMFPHLKTPHLVCRSTQQCSTPKPESAEWEETYSHLLGMDDDGNASHSSPYYPAKGVDVVHPNRGSVTPSLCQSTWADPFTPDANTSGLHSGECHITFSVPLSPTLRVPWVPSPESPTLLLPPRVTKWVILKQPAVATRRSEQLTNTKLDPNNTLGSSQPVLLDKQTSAQWKKAVGDTEPDKCPDPSKPRTDQPAPKPDLVAPVQTQTPPCAPVFEHLQVSVCKTTSVASTEHPGDILSQVQAVCTHCVPSKPDTSASNPKRDPDQAKLSWGGGVDLINMLLQAAMSTSKPV